MQAASAVLLHARDQRARLESELRSARRQRDGQQRVADKDIRPAACRGRRHAGRLPDQADLGLQTREERPLRDQLLPPQEIKLETHHPHSCGIKHTHTTHSYWEGGAAHNEP